MDQSKKKVNKYLNMAIGHIEASQKMIEDDRYCVDISHQILAALSLLRKANLEVLDDHMRHCVKEAILNNDESKLDEALSLIDKMTK